MHESSAFDGVVQVQILRVDPQSRFPLPTYAHEGDAGADLTCVDEVYIPAGGRQLVKTGIKLAIPAEMVGLVHPRSGLAAEFGLTVLNAPGTIDSGYRGEILVNLVNHGRGSVTLNPGARIAQLLIQRVERVWFREVHHFVDATERGERGHGSTGGGPSSPQFGLNGRNRLHDWP